MRKHSGRLRSRGPKIKSRSGQVQYMYPFPFKGKSVIFSKVTAVNIAVWLIRLIWVKFLGTDFLVKHV